MCQGLPAAVSCLVVNALMLAAWRRGPVRWRGVVVGRVVRWVDGVRGGGDGDSDGGGDGWWRRRWRWLGGRVGGGLAGAVGHDKRDRHGISIMGTLVIHKAGAGGKRRADSQCRMDGWMG